MTHPKIGGAISTAVCFSPMLHILMNSMAGRIRLLLRMKLKSSIRQAFSIVLSYHPTSPERRRVRFADSPSTSRSISNPLLSDSDEDAEVDPWFLPEALCTNLRPGLRNSKRTERKSALSAAGNPLRGSNKTENLASEDHSEASANSYESSSDCGSRSINISRGKIASLLTIEI